ncbi:neuronal acetylcholine receptor subunit alpha-2 isoform X1 [Hydra vulgaris]|uniref:Neuronal acetylcholine receptor subunit alpha-2 isoform X1 n=1 Tax=Hydra vulgaris TaxID=6087 RepID=A0ABM4BEE0_HYDVU
MHQNPFLYLLVVVGVKCFVETKGVGHDGPIVITDEMRLHNDLFLNRTRTVFPLTSGTLKVSFGLSLVSVVDIDIGNEIVITNINVRQKWINPLLTWKKEDYNNISLINVRSELVWTPDIFVFYNVEEDKKYNGLLDTFKTFIIVSSDGLHEWNAPVMFHMSCTMNVKDFPFETQTCPMQFSSLTYTSERVDLVPDNVDMKLYSPSAEWLYISMEKVSEPKMYPHSTTPHVDVTYTLIMKRKPLYLLLNLVIPNAIFVFLTVLVFVLPVYKGQRTPYVVTIVLAIVWFLVSSINTMTSGSEGVPLFSWFVSLSLIVVVFLMFCLCYSSTCYYANASLSELPLWIRYYVLGILARYYGIKSERVLPQWRKKLEILKKHENLKENTSLKKLFVKESDKKPGLLWSASHLTNLDELFQGKPNVKEIHKKIDYILCHMVENDDAEWLQTEWRIVSLVLDRLFLSLFLGTLTMIVFGCCIRIVYIP